MRSLTSIRLLAGTAAIAFLAACSGSGSLGVSPGPGFQHDRSASSERALGLLDPLNVSALGHKNVVGYDSCPKKGAIEYVSDYDNNVIDIFVGALSGQAPCGQITSGLFRPVGLYVDRATHDLYVADTQDYRILVFHKSQTTAYNTYTDPTGQQLALWVTIGKDGTIIASNASDANSNENGSISTWHPGPMGGTFVGNFPMTNSRTGGAITVKRDGTIFYNQVSSGIAPTLWHVKCPAGACGSEIPVAGVTDQNFGGMLFDDTGDLLMNNNFNQTVDTFELPNPQPSTVNIGGGKYPGGMALDVPHQHWFDTEEDSSNRLTYAVEYTYPGLTLIGSSAAESRAFYEDIAVDPYP